MSSRARKAWAFVNATDWVPVRFLAWGMGRTEGDVVESCAIVERDTTGAVMMFHPTQISFSLHKPGSLPESPKRD